MTDVSGDSRPPALDPSGTAVVRRRIVVRGLVQGVGFRETCRREAVQRGVGGWVRNRMDDTVEAELEGSPAAVEAVVRWARSGPRFASVTGVETTEVPVVREQDFTIRGPPSWRTCAVGEPLHGVTPRCMAPKPRNEG